MSIASWFSLYAAGLATFLSPCVLPLLPSYLAVLGGAEVSRGGRPWRAGLGFTLGLSLVFVALGLGASALSRSLSGHRQLLMLVAGAVMVLLGAKLVGLLRWARLEREARPLLSRVPSPGGFGGGLLFGIAFSLGWTPCVGPVLGATLSYAASHSASPLQAATQLAVYAMGLSTPLVAATLAAERVLALSRKLRGSMIFTQRIMGAVMMLVGALIATDRLALLAPTTAPAAEACATPDAKACAVSEDSLAAEATAEVPLGRPRLLEFVSDHCTVCARMAPALAELERACTQNDGTIVRVNVDSPAGRALARKLDVHAVPTFLQLDSRGEEVERMIGEQSHEQLALALQSVRGAACKAL